STGSVRQSDELRNLVKSQVLLMLDVYADPFRACPLLSLGAMLIAPQAAVPRSDAGYLPMPLTRARRLEAERREYRERQRRHHEAFPEYLRGWHRPTPETASRICYELLGLPLIAPPRERGTDAELAADRLATEQAVVIALDAAIRAGEAGRMMTTNLL